MVNKHVENMHPYHPGEEKKIANTTTLKLHLRCSQVVIKRTNCRASRMTQQVSLLHKLDDLKFGLRNLW